MKRKEFTNKNYQDALRIAAETFYKFEINEKEIAVFADPKDIWIEKHINFWLGKAARKKTNHKGG